MVDLPEANLYYFIINHNRLGVLKKQIASLRIHQNDIKLLIIVDHNSTYEPLLNYYEEIKNDAWIKIERMKDKYYGKKNVAEVNLARVGYRHLVNNIKKYHKIYKFKYFAKCDPDCEIPPVENYFRHFVNICKEYNNLWQVGPALRIDDIPDDYPMKENVIGEQVKNYWCKNKEKKIMVKGNKYTIYKPSAIDGTLSVFPISYLPMLHPIFCNFRAIRVGGEYQIRHLDWYTSEADEELINYIQTAGTQSTHSTNWVLGINELNATNEELLEELSKIS